MSTFSDLISPGQGSPHGYCLLWDPLLLVSQVSADLLIALAYLSIPIVLSLYAWKRPATRYRTVLWMFGAFIISCGITHMMHVWVVWVPNYGLEAIVKMVTAIISVATAVMLWPLLPKALRVPSREAVEALNERLQREIEQRKTAEHALRTANETLGLRIAKRTAELEQANQELRESEAQFRVMFELSRVGMAQIDPAGSFLLVNETFAQMLGYTPAQLFGKPFLEVTHPDDRSSNWGDFRRLLQGEIPTYQVDKRFVHRDGSVIWTHVTANLVHDPMGRPLRAIGVIQDLTAIRASEEKMRLLATVVENTQDGVLITDLESRILAVNQAFTRITGYREQEVLEKNPRLLNSGRQDESFYRNLWQALLETGHWQGELWNRRKNGDLYPEWLTLSVVRDGQGRPTHYVGIFSDLSLLKQSEARFQHLADYDVLTGLPNRALTQSLLEHAIGRAQRQQELLGLLFIDLDRFKTINDSLGHPAGDALLIAVAQRLRRRLRKEDILGRLGGDEFLAILEGLKTPGEAASVACALLAELETVFDLPDGYETYIYASVGISLYPDCGDTVAELIRNADAAMYRAKDSGRNTFAYYTPDLTRAATERFNNEKRLREALRRQEFVVHYQPLVAVTDGRLLGAEALVRWRSAGGELISPNQFIPLAEETGLIIAIGEWVLREACLQAKRWRGKGLPFDHIAVNLSVRQFRQADLTTRVAAILSETGLPPECLELEITESCLLDYSVEAQAHLHRLKELGLRLSIDDFGTGYSSLAYLKRLPIDRLKINRSFITDIPEDPQDMAIARTVIAIAHSLGLKSHAEGVETDAQLAFLQEHGCDAFQGYLYSPPLSAEAFAQQARQRSG